MKSFRIKAWFKATPRTVILDAKRADLIGAINLAKLLKVARKHKTNIIINRGHALNMNLWNKNSMKGRR